MAKKSSKTSKKSDAQELPNEKVKAALKAGTELPPEAEEAAKTGKKKAVGKTKDVEFKKISIVPIQKSHAILVLKGMPGSRLVLNRWSEKAIRQMLAKQMGIKMPRERRDPEMDWIHSFYYLPKLDGTPYDLSPDSDPEKQDGGIRTLPYQDGVRFGFPVVGIKESMASAAYRTFGYHKVQIYSAIFLHGEPSLVDGVAAVECAEILGTPDDRMDPVRNSGISRTADLRFRGEFSSWYMPVHVEYNPDVLTQQDLANLAMHAGHSVGIGEGRVEKGMEWGRFEVVSGEEAEKVLSGEYKPAKPTPYVDRMTGKSREVAAD